MRNCEDIRERLALYLDNELQGEERAAVAAHLQSCELCSSFFDKEVGFLNVVRNGEPLYVASPELRDKVKAILSGAPAGPTFAPQQTERRSMRSRRLVPVAAVLLVLLLPLIIWRATRQPDGPGIASPSSFALMAADTHLRRTRGQLPLEVETGNPERISEWFGNKVSFSVKLPNYQESSGQEKLYTLEGARLVGYREDYAAYVAYRMKQRPISLVITSEAVAKPSGGEEIAAKGLTFHYNAIQGLKVITWSDRGLTYALVSDLEERGQQSCIVCHQGTKDQDFIAPLKPK
jgi:anti-sigma factor RsiW